MFEKLVIILVIAILLTTFMNVEAKKQPSFKPTEITDIKTATEKLFPREK